MRVWIVVTLMAMAVVVWADEQPKQVKRYEFAMDTSELVEGVEGLADLLEKKLSGPAKDYYDVIIAKNKVYGKIGTRAGVILILACIVCIVLSCYFSNGFNESMSVGFGVGAVITGFVGAVLFGQNIGLLLAPEYHAMNQFLETASKFIP